MVVVRRDRQFVELLQRADDILRNHGLAIATIDDPVKMNALRRFSRCDPFDEFRKVEVSFAGTDKVDEWEPPMQLDTHLAFAVAAAESDQNVGMLFLDSAGQPE